MASDSSAKAGSKVLRGKGASPWTLSRADSRNDERDDGRSGVVGREVRVREVERFRVELLPSPDMMALLIEESQSSWTGVGSIGLNSTRQTFYR